MILSFTNSNSRKIIRNIEKYCSKESKSYIAATSELCSDTLDGTIGCGAPPDKFDAE